LLEKNVLACEQVKESGLGEAMQKIKGWLVGIDQGTFDLFTHFENGGEMWAGTGERSIRQRVHFTEPFAQPPTVQTSICLWDFDTDSGLRLDIWPEEIDTTGFNLVFRTWSDTRIARIRVTWQAFGQAR